MAEFRRWYTPQIGRRMLQKVAVPLRLLDVLVLHGQVCLALRHPRNTGPAARVAEALLATLEGVLEAGGIPAPERGWRATGPEAPAGGDPQDGDDPTPALSPDAREEG